MSEADAKAMLFNAITRHPAVQPLLFSSRKRVADRLWPRLEKAIARQVRINERRGRRWERRLARTG